MRSEKSHRTLLETALDERRSNNHVANLIPLCHQCNLDVEAMCSVSPTSEYVDPNHCTARAGMLFAENRYLAQHLCCRQGAHFAGKYLSDTSQQLDLLTDGVRALRWISGGDSAKWPHALRAHVRAGAHLGYSLLEIAVVFAGLGRKFRNHYLWQRARFLSQMGLLLHEHGLPQPSYECVLAANRLRTKFLKGNSSSMNREVELRGIRENDRHLTFTLWGSPGHRELWERARSRLRRHAKAHKATDYQQAATDHDVLGLVAGQEGGPRSKAMRTHAEHGLSLKKRRDNTWVTNSHGLNLSIYLAEEFNKTRNKSRLDRAVHLLRTSLAALSENCIVPQPTIGEQMCVSELCDVLGVHDVPLISPRGRFPLSDKLLAWVIKSAKGVQVSRLVDLPMKGREAYGNGPGTR